MAGVVVDESAVEAGAGGDDGQGHAASNKGFGHEDLGGILGAAAVVETHVGRVGHTQTEGLRRRAGRLKWGAHDGHVGKSLTGSVGPLSADLNSKELNICEVGEGRQEVALAAAGKVADGDEGAGRKCHEVAQVVGVNLGRGDVLGDRHAAEGAAAHSVLFLCEDARNDAAHPDTGRTALGSRCPGRLVK